MVPSRFQEPKSRKKQGRRRMTICAAAICKCNGKDVLLGISDRKYTSGDITYETGLLKVFGFAPHKIVALGAGDTEAHHAISGDVHRQVLASTGLVAVRDAASKYAIGFRALRRERAVNIHLAPLGLDESSFKLQQKRMEPVLVRMLAKRMTKARLNVWAIVAGVDVDGPHIYVIEEPGDVFCYDHEGFCAIGSGGRQFETLFRLAGYDRTWPLANALLLTYSAKRRAENSPNVGPTTDMWILGGGFEGWLSPSFVNTLAEYSDALDKANRQEMDRTVEKMLRDGKLFEQASHQVDVMPAPEAE
jgi:hypothetical protein